MSRVRIAVDLTELATALAESFANSLKAQGLTIAHESDDQYTTKLSAEKLAAVFVEAGRNAAGGMMLYEEDDGLDECDSVIPMPDGSTARCRRRPGHGGMCNE